ncbi:NADPH:quinone oxidoreductase family protein [Flammeovirgaceae bacterium SG7u.111]|nr:NADPH:quinone oxidoreductase family protein [Flammeovirgaceae bacterium SG7u.132]WPO34233.1 NADPH:quinone oxidoreductase family protein [Flammeovirgaceae bacterium SG7u.111]
MKAMVCRAFGTPQSLKLEDVPSPKPGVGQILISVKSAGVNFPDSLIIAGRYQFQPEMPFSPGGEVSGVVKELGEGVNHLKLGDEVIATTGWGGYAEEVTAPAYNVIPKPKTLDYDTAAGFIWTYGTAYHALKDRGELQAGQVVLVLGAAGGVGLAAVELAKAMGATVIAAASTEEKLAICKAKGADETINYVEEDLKARIKELTNKKGVDIVLDPVGGDMTDPALRGIAWGGKYLVVGFAAGSIPKLPLNLVLLKACSVTGVFWGSFWRKYPEKNYQNMLELGEMASKGLVKPHISKVYPLEKAADAILSITNRQVKGKAVVKVSE